MTAETIKSLADAARLLMPDARVSHDAYSMYVQIEGVARLYLAVDHKGTAKVHIGTVGTQVDAEGATAMAQGLARLASLASACERAA